MTSRSIAALASLVLFALFAMSTFVPTNTTQVTYAQPPTPTAECTGECRAVRYQTIVPSLNDNVEVRGAWGAPPQPCIKNGASFHMVALIGNRGAGMNTTRHRIEMGFVKAAWGASGIKGRSFLYTLCSFCTQDGGPDHFRMHMDSINILPSSTFRMEVTTGGTTRWYFTNGGGSEQEIRSFATESDPLKPDTVAGGGWSTDSRNDLGVHLNDDVDYKIGTGSWTNVSWQPSQAWAGYYSASGVSRYYTSWLDPNLWVYTDQHIGRGTQLCP